MNFWLMKTEPGTFSWDDLLKVKSEPWDGVRNYQARNFMKDMKKGDLAFIYHSVKEKSVVGVARIVKEFYQDPTTTDERWVVVDVKSLKTVPKPVTLAEIKGRKTLEELSLIKQSRLSVMPVQKKHFEAILKMGGLTLEALI